MGAIEIAEILPDKYRELNKSQGGRVAVEQLFRDMGFTAVAWRGYNFSREKPKKDSEKSAIIEIDDDLPTVPHSVAVFARDVEIGYIHPSTHRVTKFKLGRGKHRQPRTIEGSGLDFEQAYSSLLDEAFAPAELIRKYPSSPIERQIKPSDVVLIVGEGVNHPTWPRKLFRPRTTKEPRS